jgi:hypothetical protein
MQHISIETDAQLLDALETRLGRLAAKWRGTDDAQEELALVRQYQAILRCMIEMGYRESLENADAELPDRLLPQEYFDLFKSS